MSAHKVRNVLNDGWSDYDDDPRKKKVDARFFSCTEEWEVDYLVKKIHLLHPEYSTASIREAIRKCCQSVPGNHPRERFVECVMSRLDTDGSGGPGSNPPPPPNPDPQDPPYIPGKRPVA